MSSVICHDLTALATNASSRKPSQFSGPARLKGGKSSGKNVEDHERNPEQPHTASRHLKLGQHTRPHQGKLNLRIFSLLTSRLAGRCDSMNHSGTFYLTSVMSVLIQWPHSDLSFKRSFLPLGWRSVLSTKEANINTNWTWMWIEYVLISVTGTTSSRRRKSNDDGSEDIFDDKAGDIILHDDQLDSSHPHTGPVNHNPRTSQVRPVKTVPRKKNAVRRGKKVESQQRRSKQNLVDNKRQGMKYWCLYFKLEVKVGSQ